MDISDEENFSKGTLSHDLECKIRKYSNNLIVFEELFFGVGFHQIES